MYVLPLLESGGPLLFIHCINSTVYIDEMKWEGVYEYRGSIRHCMAWRHYGHQGDTLPYCRYRVVVILSSSAREA